MSPTCPKKLKNYFRDRPAIRVQIALQLLRGASKMGELIGSPPLLGWRIKKSSNLSEIVFDDTFCVLCGDALIRSCTLI